MTEKRVIRLCGLLSNTLSLGIDDYRIAVVEAFLSKTKLSANPLTARERQVIQLIEEGKSICEVATLLGISVKTAESHRARLMQKLDIHETASLVRYAFRQGLLQP